MSLPLDAALVRCAVIALAVLGSLACDGRAPAPRPPNLILVSLDTLRADHLGTYGYERETSPAIDAFAADAIVFEQCIAPSSWTTPSHASLFTGHHPIVHGAGAPATPRLREGFTTLFELAREQGHRTAAFTEGGAVGASFGFDQGFDQYAEPVSKPGSPPLGLVETTFGQAGDWLEANASVPFAVFVHTYEIHWPYRAPAPFASRFQPQNDRPLTSEEALDPHFQSGDLDDAQQRSFVAAYDAEIAYTDSVFGRFVDRLDGLGLLDDSIVVVFSDHGEEFWDHGGIQHGNSSYEEMLRVPLVVRLPGADRPRLRVQRLVSLTDVFATVVDLMGLRAEVPPESRSLRPLWEPSAGEYVRDWAVVQVTKPRRLELAARSADLKYIVATRFADRESPLHARETRVDVPAPKPELRLVEHLLDGGRDLTGARSRAERRRRSRSASEELYDLRSDPREVRRLERLDQGALDRARAQLKKVLVELDAETSRVQAAADAAAPLSGDEKEALRALGYLE